MPVYFSSLEISHCLGEHCEVCQRSKRKFDKPAPSLHPIPVSDTWNKVGIDLIELPVSSRGNCYCITLTDYFSKWAEAMPVPTKEASHVADFLYKMIFRHGCPEEIISDQGRERLPIDITQPKPEGDTAQELTLDEKVQKMIAFQKEIHDKARDNVVKAQEKQKQQYDAKHNGRTELKVRSIQNIIISCYV